VERLLACGHNVRVLVRERVSPGPHDMLEYLKVSTSKHSFECHGVMFVTFGNIQPMPRGHLRKGLYSVVRTCTASCSLTATQRAKGGPLLLVSLVNVASQAVKIAFPYF
jgi:hypothetical protein